MGYSAQRRANLVAVGPKPRRGNSGKKPAGNVDDAVPVQRDGKVGNDLSGKGSGVDASESRRQARGRDEGGSVRGEDAIVAGLGKNPTVEAVSGGLLGTNGGGSSWLPPSASPRRVSYEADEGSHDDEGDEGYLPPSEKKLRMGQRSKSLGRGVGGRDDSGRGSPVAGSPGSRLPREHRSKSAGTAGGAGHLRRGLSEEIETWRWPEQPRPDNDEGNSSVTTLSFDEFLL